ncbi:aminopeptidase [bacterium]|nr:MAG: aminopeptidase [bacterium]
MHDSRFDKLADVLVNHSTKLQAGENVLIEATDVPEELTITLVKAAARAGANVMVNTRHSKVSRALFMSGNEETMKLNGAVALNQMKQAQAFIAVHGGNNTAEFSDVPSDTMKLYSKHWHKPLHIDYSVKHTRWCILRYPTSGMAQAAQQSTEAFEEFFFNVCTFDYSRMEKAAIPLKELMERTDKVHIKGQGTDLTFSIKGIGVIPCNGEHNIPDGECFTAPIRDSVNGQISYNAPTISRGITHENVVLRFENGKIIEATSSATEKLNEVLDSDEGARYIGEFAIGYNPYIMQPMKDILFDEKIAGSFHFTPGQAYEEADNGNRSQVHWDMVCIQRPEFGGGEIWFDDVLIRKDGLFVLPELEGLNPENLKGE